MSNKSYGLGKERQLKQILYKEGAVWVGRCRGSFGCFDVLAAFPEYLLAVSCKSTKQKYFSYGPEMVILQKVKLPSYIKKQLRIYFSPNKERDFTGWDIVDVKDKGE